MAYWLLFWAYLHNKNHFYKYWEQFVHGRFWVKGFIVSIWIPVRRSRVTANLRWGNFFLSILAVFEDLSEKLKKVTWWRIIRNCTVVYDWIYIGYIAQPRPNLVRNPNWDCPSPSNWSGGRFTRRVWLQCFAYETVNAFWRNFLAGVSSSVGQFPPWESNPQKRNVILRDDFLNVGKSWKYLGQVHNIVLEP